MWVRIDLDILVGLACDHWCKWERWCNRLMAIWASHHLQRPIGVVEEHGAHRATTGLDRVQVDRDYV
jgi:hypothetical protein